MKQFLFGLFLICAFASCNNKQTKTKTTAQEPWREIIKRNRIKEYEIRDIPFKFGDLDSSDFFVDERGTYDTNGNLVLVVKYERSAYMKDFEDSTINLYDGNGNNFESKTFSLSGNLKSIDKRKFDSKNNMTELVSYDSSGNIQVKATYRYNGYGKLVEMLAYDKTGEFDYKTVYNYDTQGRDIKEETISDDTTYAGKRVFVYNGNQSVCQTFNWKGELIYISTDAKNSNDQTTLYSTAYPNGEKNKTEFVYDGDFLKRKTHYDKSGEKDYLLEVVYKRYK